MIDLHTHILPQVDDGASDRETALAMGRFAEKQGLTVLAATPHFDQIPDWDLIKKKVAELKREFAKAEIGITLVAGAELFVDPLIVEMAAGEIPTYGDGGRYCLLELPLRQISIYAEEVLFSLQIKGITPIIAHPERCQVVRENPNVVLDWWRRGCLIQMNSGSLLGHFGPQIQDTAKIMLTHRMVHFLGSDGHGLKHRTLNLAAGRAAAEGILGAAAAWDLVKTNPAAVLAGAPLQVAEPRQYVKRRRFFFF